MAKKLKLKTKAGKVVDFPVRKVKGVLSGAGFTGKLLIHATGGVFNEAKKLAKEGVVTTTNLEKAIVRSVANTNKIAINSAQKFTKRLLK